MKHLITKFMQAAIFCMTLFSSTLLLASTQVDLFQGEVVVKDRSVHTWRAGVKNVLHEVLVKATGNPNINTIPGLTPDNNELRGLIQRFSYHRKRLYGQNSQLFLSVQFDPSEIKQMLANLHQPIWNANRPRTLLWLAIKTGDEQTEILSSDQRHQYLPVLNAAAQKRGIPIVLPMMDLTDIATISAKDVWSFNAPLIDEAGKRYNADSFMMARISFDQDQYWHVSVQWVNGGDTIKWDQKSSSADNLISSMIDRLSNEMAVQFVSLKSADQAHTVSVRVISVSGLDEYSKVVSYLKQITSINDIELDSMESDAVILSINFGGDKQSLHRAIANAKGHRLSDVQSESIEMNDSDQNNMPISLILQWHQTV